MKITIALIVFVITLGAFFWFGVSWGFGRGSIAFNLAMMDAQMPANEIILITAQAYGYKRTVTETSLSTLIEWNKKR